MISPEHTLLRHIDGFRPWRLDIFEPGVRACFSPILTGWTHLFPEEEACTRNFREKRRREFATGRWCGRRAMQELGLPPLPIGMGGEREPIWPMDVTGSISHCDDLCCAVVSRGKRLIGIDLEKRSALLGLDLLELICSDMEREQLGSSIASVGASGPALIFSAKEAFYKMVFPSVKRFVGFLDVRTNFRWDEGTFEVQLMRDLNEKFPLGARLQGKFSVSENHILCFMST